MYILECILIGVSLAMDAFAICLCQGMVTKERKYAIAIKFAVTFGMFQFLMPVLGFYLGNIFSDKVSTFGSFLAFIILVGIGINMIREEAEESCDVVIGLKALMSLGIATSIDALAVGLTFSINGEKEIVFPGIIIGIVTFIISFLAIFLGERVGSVLGKKAHYLGGTILIILGIKTLVLNFI